MSRAYQAPFYALFLIAIFFTMQTVSGLTRVDPRAFRPMNNTMPQQKQWDQQHGMTPNPHQGWASGGGSGVGGTNVNQWNQNNQTNRGIYNGGYQNPSMTDPWQRYNNTPSYPGTYNPGLPGWNPQQQQPQPQPHAHPHLPNTTKNWQRPNQSHLYPQLPQANIGGYHRPQPLAPTTPSHNSNHWNNTHGRWNNTYMPSPQQYPGGVGGLPNQNSWQNTPNRNWGTNAPTASPPIYNPNASKGIPQGFQGGYLQNQTAGGNWYNLPNATNNQYGWGGSNAGQGNWGGNPSGVPSNGGNSQWPNGGQNNWQGSSNPTGNANWASNTGRVSSGGSQGNSGVPLVPIGGGNGISSSAGGVPLAPIGGNSASNSWNAGGNSSPQLAPLAPLSYGGGGGTYDTSKMGNTNPYSKMFN